MDVLTASHMMLTGEKLHHDGVVTSSMTSHPRVQAVLDSNASLSMKIKAKEKKEIYRPNADQVLFANSWKYQF